MSWVAVAVAGSAAIGAYSSNKQAKAANKSKSTTTDQTDTRDPFLYDAYAPDIGEVLARQRGIAAQGAPMVGKNGQIYYADAPRAGAPGAGGEGFAGVDTGGKAKANPAAASWDRFLASGGDKNDTAAWQAFKKSAPASAGGSPKAGTPSKPASAEDIFRDVAKRGIAAGDAPTVKTGQEAVKNILGAAGGGGPEDTGFEGYNPILDRLTGTLEGDVKDRVGRDLLLSYLDGPGGGGLGGGGGRVSPRDASAAHARYVANQQAGGAGGGSYSSVVGGVPVPDASGEGLFGTEIRKFFDEPSNEAELQALIDANNKDTERGMFRDLAQLDAASQSGGRFGGDMWKGMSSDARRAALDAMAKSSAGVRIGDRNERRNARLAAEGLINQRDLGSLQAKTQLDIADRNASAAGAGSAAAEAIARRGQDLAAISDLMNNERYSLGQLGQVGAQLSGDRLGAMGLIPGIQGVGLQGLNVGLGGGNGLVDLQRIAAEDAASRRSAGIARAGQAQQLGMFNAGQQQNSVNDYLGTLLRIGGMGGTSTTQGTNVVPGAGINAGAAALQGGLGAGLSTYGALKGGGR